MESGEPHHEELDTASFKRALDVLSDLGVFHVALGGGEALLRRDLFDLAAYARSVGLVPNLTISGANMNRTIASQMRVFGQVNVSVDGVGQLYNTFRREPGFEAAKAALSWLVDARVPAGINCVVGRENFQGIESLFSLAADVGANEIEFLRLKPSGRAAETYDRQKTSYRQNTRLISCLTQWSETYGVVAKVDCSFLPMLVEENPPQELLQQLAAYGCEAGNVLLGIRSNGLVCGCSFLNPLGFSVFALADSWHDAPDLAAIRTFVQNAPEPCMSCNYLAICKGGCRAVALVTSGNSYGLDPDCPRVVRYKQEEQIR
jgi:radical SAM protein with 4Fe4S-binding SPASM domain